MEYGTFIGDDNDNNMKDLQTSLKMLTQPINGPTKGFTPYDDRLDMNQFVGWYTITDWDPLPQKLFTRTTLRVIQNKVADYLTGVDPNGKRIIPSDRVVVAALFGVFKDHHPQTGDIYGKYSVVDPTQRDDYAYIIDKTISLLVQGIRDEIGMAEQNQKLTVWTTLYGDFNEHGLRQFPPIKVNNKRPDPMLFHMRY